MSVLPISANTIESGDLPAGRSRPASAFASAYWLLVVACVVIATIERLSFLAYPFPNDPGLYIYLGKCVATGGRLYVDFFDTKLPGVAIFTSICWRMFGSHWAGYVILQWVLSLVAALAMARAVGRCSGGSATAAFAFAMVFGNFGPLVGTGFQLETIQIFFESLGALAAARCLNHRAGSIAPIACLAVGLAGGCAAMIKPSGCAVMLATLITLLIRQRWVGWRCFMSSAGMMALGAAVPLAVVVAFVIHTGITGEMPNLFRQISLYGSQTPRDWGMIGISLFVLLMLGFPMLIRGWVFRRDASGGESRDRSLFWFAGIWLVLETIGVMMQARMYAYYFLVMVPPAAMLFGLFPRRTRFGSLASGLLPMLLWSLWWCQGRVRLNTPQTNPAIVYLAQHCQPNDSIFLEQDGGALLQTGLRPGSRLGTTFYFLNYDDAPLDYCQILLGDFDQRHPRYILLDRQGDAAYQMFLQNPILQARPVRRKNVVIAWARLREYVQQHYELETVIGGSEIWRLRNPMLPGSQFQNTAQNSQGREKQTGQD